MLWPNEGKKLHVDFALTSDLDYVIKNNISFDSKFHNIDKSKFINNKTIYILKKT